jgi:hypothetical protein
MYRLKEKFENERHSKSKQTTLTDLFKRAVASSNPSLSADSVTLNPDAVPHPLSADQQRFHGK